MGNDITNYDPHDDGFAGWSDQREGAEERAGGLIKGVKLKFLNTGRWDPEDLEREKLIVVKQLRCVQKWSLEKKPVETEILRPNEPFPDIEARNNALPKSEWVEGPVKGQLVGPWQTSFVLYLINPASMEEITYPTATVGGSIAIGELIDKLLWMRRSKNNNRIYPIVHLSSKSMKTGYGERPRPFFIIMGWTTMGADTPAEKLLTAPATAVNALPERSVDRVLHTPAEPQQPREPRQFVTAEMARQGFRPVERPTAAEELNDALPPFA